MNEVESLVNEGESGASAAAAATAAAATAGLTAAAHGQQADEEAEKKAAEQLALATKSLLDAARAKGKQRAAYWDTLVPVLKPVAGRLKCMVMCTKGGEGICGKLLSTRNVSKSAKDHYTFHSCKGVRIKQGQAMLQVGPNNTPGVGSKRPAESSDSAVASSSKQPRSTQQLITQHAVNQHAMQQAAWHLAQFFFTSNTAWRLAGHKNLVTAFESLGMPKEALPTRKVRKL